MNLLSIPLSEVLKNVNPAWVKLRDSFLLGKQAPSQRELEDFIIDLVPALNALAQNRRIFAAWSLETIFLDAKHRAYLSPGYSTPLQKQYAPESLFAGFAALEQYTLHDSYPLGSHTDVYGLAMILRTIILRIIPSPAIDRLEQEIEPLSSLNPPGFSRLFLRALDQASALQHTERLRTIQEWTQMLNLIGPAPQDLIDRLHRNYAHLLQQQYLLLKQHQSGKPTFFDPEHIQAKHAYSYRAPLAPVFSSTYRARHNTGLMVGRREHVIKDISPTPSHNEKDQRLADQEWTQQRQRSASMVPVTQQNKTTSRSSRKSATPAARQRAGWGIPILLANILIACTSIYFVVYHKPPASEPAIQQQEQAMLAQRQQALAAAELRQRELAQAEQQAAERGVAEQRAAEQRAAEQRAAEQRAAEQRAAEQRAAKQQERERALAAQRQQDQEMAAQRQRELAAAELRQRQRAQVEQQAAERRAAEQRQRSLSASQQVQRTQSENTTQREQNLAQTLRDLDKRSAPSTAITPGASAPTTSTTQTPSAAPTVARATNNIGTVRFNIRPWGNITINGTNHGASPPLTNLRLAPGTYSVRVENGNFPAYTTSITVSAGQSTTLSHGFRR